MKVANIFLSSQWGGAEQAHVNTARVLQHCGCQVFSVAHPNSKYLPDLASHSEEVFLLSANGLYDLFAAYRLRKFLKKHQITHIVAHNTRALMLASYARLASMKLIGFSHSDKAKRFKRADNVVVLTHAMKEKFIRSGVDEGRISVIPNVIEPLEHKENCLESGVSEPLRLGFLGRLVQEKGLVYLLKAVDQLVRTGCELSLRVAGDGPDMEEVKGLIKQLGIEEKVILDGWVSDKDLWFSKIDVLVVPSLNESFGMVVVEGMQRGKLILSSDADGPSEIFRTCFDRRVIFPRADVDACARAIMTFYEDRYASEAVIKFNLDRVKDFSIPKIAEQYQQCFLLSD